MANDGKIYIIVTNQLPNGTPEPVPGAGTDKKEKEEKNVLEDFALHKFRNLVESQAKQTVNYTISNIGNFSGDYVTQTHTQDAMEALGFLVNLGTAAYAGFKYGGGVWGAVVAAGAVAVSTGISKAEQYYAGYVANTRQNRDIAQLRTRAGLNSTNNGSRGTEY